ncbi:MAG: UDP-glucuronic acid decarboxylase family protein [Phycisphaerales bacterium]
MEERKRVLVTGGAGFIGSHLCQTLLNKGNEVFCVDSLITGSINNLLPFRDNPRFTFIEHDIINPLSMEIDEIYNLACPASPYQYQKDPIHTTLTNVIGSKQLLELAGKTNARILQASTSEVYGDPTVNPQDEQYKGNVNIIGPRACYDEGKRCAETLYFDYRRKYGTNIKVVRIFNTYGPNMQLNDGRVMTSLITRALNNEDLIIYGNGLQTRSFCYISDLVEGITDMMASDSSFTGPVNIGNDEEITINFLAELIIKLCNSQSCIVHADPMEDDPKMRRPDLHLANNILGWKAKTSLSEGLNHTIQYIEHVLISSKKQ